MDILSQLISGKDIDSRRKVLKTTFETMKIKSSELPMYVDQGWEKAKDYKNPAYVLVKRDLPEDVLFSNNIWRLFSSMGFDMMNGSSDFSITFDEEHSDINRDYDGITSDETRGTRILHSDISRQFDVIAADEETVLLVTCKFSPFQTESNFFNDLNSFQAQIGGIRTRIQKEMGKRKVKFIWAAHNFILRKLDLDVMKNLNIAYFDESAIDYFNSLVNHLGSVAKYQLLGNLFAKQEISNMDNRIPAIKGKMGGYTYYAFSIEPEKLLKIGYVLHRTEANSNMMPTYQRLIKKSRLKDVRAFIDNGGYFPNSIIISIDTDGKGLQFQQAGPKIDNSISKIGILYIPKKYHTAYIIDGQHRLYGYSDSQYASTNTIPVVAFEDLDRNEQIKLFMDINENQKAVPKSLRVTLNADMLWDSESKAEQRQALRSKIAQMLGEKSTSPLRDKIILGESEPTPAKCITVEAIQTALKQSSFFASYGKRNEIVKDGTFETGNNEEDCNIFYPFIEHFFLFVQKMCPEEWNKTENDNCMITMNRGIQAIIRVLDDIVSMLSEKGMLRPKEQSPEDMLGLIGYYISPLIDYLNTVGPAERKDLRGYFGGSANTRFYRAYQRVIAEKRPDYTPEGLKEYWDNESMTYNPETKEFIRAIEKKLKDIIRSKLENYFGNSWLVNGLPKNVYQDLTSQANDEAYNKAQEGITDYESDPWDYVDLSQCRAIAINGKNWSTIFENTLVTDDEKDLSGDKNEKTEWIMRINKIKNRLGQNGYSVSSDDYQFVMGIHNWISDILIL